ncbi:glutamine amidotransferase [Streptomyces sp. A7024]|uniref:Glutamine amidotransferase n=1 Tax=Streptomyces coryli TaxID=1128680 RepID=A0A6G4U1B0_9ACTN|nr:DJ-1/PfpI family protein [Streptomyces coryli]NGN66049.1 glutamine amidotransferase [Streptomyces coryli]
MARKTVHFAVYDQLADWEIGHALAHIRDTSAHRPPRDTYDTVSVGASRGDVITSIGGMHIQADIGLDELRPQDSSLLILPGSGAYDQGEELAPFVRKAREFLDAGVPVAAICGATAGLAREGLLDERAHTSGAAEYLAAQPGYKGHDRYAEADAVTDGDLITAGPVHPVPFAREIFRRLDLHEPAVLDAWERLFGAADPSAFPVLMEASAK